MKLYKPTTPGRRGMTGIVYRSMLTRSKPRKSLTKGISKSGGRNRQGRITVRFRGGGSKRRYRIIDFRQQKLNIPGIVESIEYDPNRTAFIALVKYRDGEYRYILAPEGLKVNAAVLAAEQTPLAPGNRMQLKHIPVGTLVHNVELFPGKGGQVVRSAGSSARVLAHDGGFTNILMPSSETRRVPAAAFASVGGLSNYEHRAVNFGKAGRVRGKGRRPHVRGSAMNPVDHPHGGGEGRSPIGLKYPKTPWGKHALGVKTRKKRKTSNIYIVSRRRKRGG